MKSVAATLALFRDIALLRRGPEELPVSWVLLLTTVVGVPVLGAVIGVLLPPLPPRPVIDEHWVALLAVDLVVPTLWGLAILQMVGRTERYVQMMTAVFGSQLVLQPLILCAYWAARYFPKASMSGDLGQILYLGLSVWSTVVLARIVRAATDWSMFFCLVAVIVQGLAAFLVTFAMFPEMAELLKQDQ